MKQSAVEWLEKELNAIRLDVDKNVLKFIDKSFEIAKEIENEQGYSEEEVIEILLNCRGENPRYIEEWFEQFKKK